MWLSILEKRKGFDAGWRDQSGIAKKMTSAGLAVEIDPGGRTSEGPDYFLGIF